VQIIFHKASCRETHKFIF